ncbi:putative magnesium transporter MRS2-D [Phragmites australis]|uniref:putative magnesium transporter MRS2-D n=1 Tax=Phragmites australis TaxID=29695 RepID=UPI002D77EFE4|nr:putative magnesium transporter MRS2-D [Phragmites australis]
MASTTPAVPRWRHAAAGEWAAVSSVGAWRVEEVGKHQQMRRTRLPVCNLHALDPALSYPSSIMGWDRVVVVNLERIHTVITATEVLVPGPRDLAITPLVWELRTNLENQAGKDGVVSPPSPRERGGDKDGQALGSDKALPFEFRALEVCLEFTCKSLEQEVQPAALLIF